MRAEQLAGGISLYNADCRDVLRALPDSSIDSVVTDPPYALVQDQRSPLRASSDPAQRLRVARGGFMGKQWDTGDTAHAVEFWAEVLRVLKPGGHVVAFAGTRTYHRLAVAIEDAGFEIRDQLQWIYGQGFPKSLNVSKQIDKAAGAEREVIGDKVFADGPRARKTQKLGGNATFSDPISRETNLTITAPATDDAAKWDGWHTALKPAHEPICLARKPLGEGTVAANVMRWGVGALNIDGCRIEYEDTKNPATNPLYRVQNGYRTEVGSDANGANISIKPNGGNLTANVKGRWPANLILDGSEEVVGMFPNSKGQLAAVSGREPSSKTNSVYGQFNGRPATEPRGDSGSAARFFYSAKATRADRAGSKHPTVKPIALMQWLCRLITPPGGTILDPFAGSGTTGAAAHREGFNAILCERESEYAADIRARFADIRTNEREPEHVAPAQGALL